MLRSQGIKGPSCKFNLENSKEVYKMRRKSIIQPAEFSHHILPGIQPHSWINMYMGRNVLSWNGSVAHLIITEPDLIKEIFNNKNGVYSKSKIKAVGFMKKGDGLVSETLEGLKWVRQHKLANHVFEKVNIIYVIPAMLTSVEMIVERWRHFEGKEIEIFEEFKVATAYVISKAAFGSNYLEGAKIFQNISKLA
ncbi:hypothetical protein GIB67_036754 [Kingdonia uniflora]|uniref:Cytochrome P450 n=1 Tax=Kingdonia uniflora TaxID=39325 RepID=A0A7J7LWP1_9MAGN|nr:hypothetical protein GIB67_036754 [Kingdonia uniflora]